MAKPKHVYLIAAARKVWYWGPERKAAIKAAMVGKEHIRCAKCRKLVSAHAKIKKRKLFQVDHIEPVVPMDRSFPQLPPLSDSLGWDEYLQRLIFGALQVLCIPCHSKKSKAENKARRECKRKR